MDVEKVYEEYDNKRRSEFGKVTRETSKGFFIPSSLVHLKEAFKILLEKEVIKKDMLFLDAGAGDGRVVALANSFGLNAYGIESEEEFFKKAKEVVKERVVKGNFLKEESYTELGINFKEFEIVYNFANSCYEIAEKIVKESKKDTVFLFYDTAKRPTVFNNLKYQETLTLIDENAKEYEGDLPMIVDYVHIYKK